MILIVLLLIIFFLKYFGKESFICDNEIKIPIEKSNIETAKKKLQEYITKFNNSLQAIRDKQGEIFTKNNILKELLLDVNDKYNIILQENDDVTNKLNTTNIKENLCYDSNNIKLTAIRNIYS